MFTIDKEQFGAFVTHLRKEKGYTQKELAQKLYISDKAVSKWETAASIPDTALLIPLAELLGVSVTELLLCRRVEHEDTMKADEVENIVKKAISYPEEKTERAYGQAGKWLLWYGISFALGLGILLWLYFHTLPELLASVTTLTVLAAIFGAYFCFFARLRLPNYYDQNKVSFVSDGIFRMNMAGLFFNNSNWPHILTVGRVWSCASMAALPVLWAILLHRQGNWLQAGQIFLLFPYMAGLFVPMYVVGKRYYVPEE